MLTLSSFRLGLPSVRSHRRTIYEPGRGRLWWWVPLLCSRLGVVAPSHNVWEARVVLSGWTISRDEGKAAAGE